MRELPPNDNAILHVTYEDLLRFLSETGAGPCEACGKSVWRVSMESDDQSDTLAVAQWMSVRDPDRALWVFTVTCGNCGNIRSHNANIVAAWVVENPDVHQE